MLLILIMSSLLFVNSIIQFAFLISYWVGICIFDFMAVQKKLIWVVVVVLVGFVLFMQLDRACHLKRDFFFLSFFFSFETGSYSVDWHQTPDSPASTSQVPGLQMCITIPKLGMLCAGGEGWGVFCRHVYLCTTYMICAHGYHKRVSDFLGLKLQMIVSCCGFHETNPGPFQEQPALWTVQPSL